MEKKDADTTNAAASFFRKPRSLFPHFYGQTGDRTSFRYLLMEKMVTQDNKLHRVVDRIYLSSIGGAYNREAMLSEGITHVLSIGFHLPTPFQDDFKYYTFNVQDSQYADLLDKFPSCVEIMSKAIEENPKNKVLVHCFAGISRSVSIIVAYLMQEFNMTFKQGLQQVRCVRPEALPNEGFVSQLKHYEKMLQGNIKLKEGNDY